MKVAVYETVVGLVIPKGVSGGLDIECYGCAMPNDWLKNQMAPQTFDQIMRNFESERKLTSLGMTFRVVLFVFSLEKLMWKSLLRCSVYTKAVVFHYSDYAADFKHVFIAILWLFLRANLLPEVDLDREWATLDRILDCVRNNLEQNLVVEVPVSVQLVFWHRALFNFDIDVFRFELSLKLQHELLYMIFYCLRGLRNSLKVQHQTTLLDQAHRQVAFDPHHLLFTESPHVGQQNLVNAKNFILLFLTHLPVSNFDLV